MTDPAASAVKRFPELADMDLEMQSPSGKWGVPFLDVERTVYGSDDAIRSLLTGARVYVEREGLRLAVQLTPKSWKEPKHG